MPSIVSYEQGLLATLTDNLASLRGTLASAGSAAPSSGGPDSSLSVSIEAELRKATEDHLKLTLDIEKLNDAMPKLVEEAERAKQRHAESLSQLQSSRLQHRRRLEDLYTQLSRLQRTENWNILEGLVGRRILFAHAKVVDCLSKLRANARMCDTGGQLSLSMALTSDFRDLVREYVTLYMEVA
jgi:hypothetical protein